MDKQNTLKALLDMQVLLIEHCFDPEFSSFRGMPVLMIHTRALGRVFIWRHQPSYPPTEYDPSAELYMVEVGTDGVYSSPKNSSNTVLSIMRMQQVSSDFLRRALLPPPILALVEQLESLKHKKEWDEGFDALNGVNT